MYLRFRIILVLALVPLAATLSGCATAASSQAGSGSVSDTGTAQREQFESSVMSLDEKTN